MRLFFSCFRRYVIVPQILSSVFRNTFTKRFIYFSTISTFLSVYFFKYKAFIVHAEIVPIYDKLLESFNILELKVIVY